jgi:methyl-accepting chemotaxis protein
MSEHKRGRELEWFGVHLLVASLAFALVLALGLGAAMLVRWAVPLELASSSPQRALVASGRILEMHERFWPVVLVSLLGVALAAGWLGRRITGPLVRFTQAFERLGAGGFPEPIRIRGTDYLANEVAALNEMIGALRARAARQQAARGEVLATLEELVERSSRSGADDVTELAERGLAQMKALDDGPP